LESADASLRIGVHPSSGSPVTLPKEDACDLPLRATQRQRLHVKLGCGFIVEGDLASDL
jgi:hypothetical protein